MSDIQELTALVQLLATNQAQDMQRVNAVLEDILNRNQNSDASEAEEVELPAREVLPGRVARVDVNARGDENRGNYSMARELGKEIPTLTDRNYSLWKEHVLAYGRAAEWGTSDIPEVLTDANHPRAKEAKDFLFIKLGPTLQRRILQKNITTAADLWSYLTTAVADASRESLMILQQELFSTTLQPNETIDEYAVRIQELRDAIAMGGIDISDAQLVMYLIKDLPDRLMRAADEISVRDTSFSQAVLILTRAELRAKTSNSGSSHAFLAGCNKKPPPLPANALLLSRDDHFCHRCRTKGHLAQICPAPTPSPEAYPALEKYLSLPKKKFNKNKQQDAHAGIVSLLVSQPSFTYRWIVDSGSSDHMSPDFDRFTDYCPMVPEPVNFGNGAKGYALGKGDISLYTTYGVVTLKRVLFVPVLVANLVSITRTMKAGADVHFISSENRVYFTRNDKVICSASPQGGLVLVDEDVSHSAYTAVHDPHEWHRKLGHLGFDSLAKLARKGIFSPGNPAPAEFLQAKDKPCEECIEAKYIRHPHPKSVNKPTIPLFRLHSDVHFVSDPSVTGHIGFVSFTECITDFAVTTLIKKKHEVATAIVNAVAFFETQYVGHGYKIKRIRSDNGGEYKSSLVADFCAKKGIVQEFSSRETPQQNGRSERFGRGVKDKARTMLLARKVHFKFWPYAVMYATLARNCSPTVHQPETPYFAFYGIRPDLSLFEEFGCPAWVQTPEARRTSTMQARAVKGIFLGLTLPLGSRSSYALINNKVIVSTDVTCLCSSDKLAVSGPSDIMQDAEPLLSGASPAPSPSSVPAIHATPSVPQLPPVMGLRMSPSTWERAAVDFIAAQTQAVRSVPEVPTSAEVAPAHVPSRSTEIQPEQLSDTETTADSMPSLMWSSSPDSLSPVSSVMPGDLPVVSVDTISDSFTNPIFDEGREEVEEIEVSSDVQLQTGANHRGSRVRNQPVRYGYAAYVAPSYESFSKNLLSIVASNPELHHALTASTGVLPDPRSIAEATNPGRPDSHLWQLAIDNEFQSLVDKGVYAEALLPPGAKALGTRPLLITKRDGTKKCRIVAQGFSQRPGVDFDETFAPVCRYATLRNFLALCAANELQIQQLDVKVAFLNATLDEEVYARPPEGYKCTIPRAVWRLYKALYGLRQAPRAWYSELRAKLRELGFAVSAADPSLFVLQSADGTVLALIYVDDCLIAARTLADLHPVLEAISKFWDIKNLGEPADFLGISIVRPSPSCICIHQKEYIHKLAELYDVQSMSPRCLPMDPKVHFVKDMGPPMEAAERYRALVGALLHLANCTRPDISFAVGVLSRYSQSPCESHWEAALGTLRYCLHTSSLALTYGARQPGETLAAQVYHDSDFASSQDCRRSTSGYVVVLNNAAVTWASKKREAVALSTMEAEYQSASLCGREVIWLRKLWPQLGFPLDGPTLIHGDNKACLALCSSQQTTPQSKHIHVIHCWVSEKVEDKELKFEYIPSAQNAADIFTKALFKPAFEELRGKLGLHEITLEQMVEEKQAGS